MATDRRYKSRFRMADQFLWDDPEFKKLSATPSAQLLLLFLEQGPHSTPIPGVFSAGRAALAERKCWKQSVFDRVFRELEAAEFAVADWSAPLVWLPRALKDHAAPKSETNVKAWVRAFMELPECDLKKRVRKAIVEFLNVYAPDTARGHAMTPVMGDAYSGEGAANGEGTGGSSVPPPSSVVGNGTEPRCYHCQKQGHFASACPEKGGAKVPAEERGFFGIR